MLRSCYRMVLLFCVWVFALLAQGTETEHFGVQVVPAPGKVVLDGQYAEWDLSGGVFVCSNVEETHDRYHVWCHLMYDTTNLYVLARWKDETPMDNPGDVKAEQMPFQHDSLQLRLVTHYGEGVRERVTHVTAWSGKDGAHVIDLCYGRQFNEGRVKDAQTEGAKQAFRKDEDGKGYVQEMAIPWALLTKDGKPLMPADSFRMTVEPNFSAGIEGRLSSKDIFMPDMKIDKVFTFMAFDQWGIAMLEPKGFMAPRPVRLTDGRLFPTHLEEAAPGVPPVIDWTGLVKDAVHDWVKKISFTLPVDGYVSLNILNKDGVVVRQLLTANWFTKGTHEVVWDGLTTPLWKTPGQPVPAGDYTWSALYHTGIGVRLRGWADNAGQVPWDNGPTSNWGGDQGPPLYCASDDKYVYLGWNGAESGKALVACDRQGNVRWRNNRGGFGGAHLIAVDNGTIYVFDGNKDIYRLAAETGEYTFWQPSDSPDLMPSAIWPDPVGRPEQPAGMDAKNGTLYLSFGTAWFQQADVQDWQKFLTAIATHGDHISAFVWNKMDAEVRSRADRFLKSNPSNLKMLEGQPFVTTDVREVVITALTELQRDPRLYTPERFSQPQIQSTTRALFTTDVDHYCVDEIALANRRLIEDMFPGVLAKSQTNVVALVDGTTGKLRSTIPVNAPGYLKAVNDRLVYAVSAKREIVAIDPRTQQVRTIIKGVKNATGLTVDDRGNIYVGVQDPANQVLVYSDKGKLLRTIGQAGGRPLFGPWVADGMAFIKGITVDADGKLWVAENDDNPKRFSVWDTTTGHLVKELFGPTHYGASGGAINPDNPNIMIGAGCEWQVDPQSGLATCLGTFERNPRAAQAARYCRGANGKSYIITIDTWGDGMKVYERLAPAQCILRARITSHGATHSTTYWADQNGDQQEQTTEVLTLPYQYWIGGGWYLNMNPADMTIYAGVEIKKTTKTDDGQTYDEYVWDHAVQIPVVGFTACGAPRFDFTGGKTLPMLVASLPSLDDRVVLSRGFDQDQQFRCYDVATGKLRWTYPNPFAGIHGSHAAPPPQSGLIRGSFAPIGTATLPKPLGAIWAINTNVGEWHLLTEDGFYLSRLFEGDAMKVKWPTEAKPGVALDQSPCGAGGEDFGGSMVQGTDGKVYLQAGKLALWNTEMTGLESVRALPGEALTLTATDVEQAGHIRETLLQDIVGLQHMTIRRKTPALSGDINGDFAGCDFISYRKQDDARVRSTAAWDETNLYLAWDVTDATPWVNNADSPEYLYAHGDTVDFQLGTDPTAPKERSEARLGDLRLSIGNFQETPTAVLYRKVWTDRKNQRVFSSGVIKEYLMDYVAVVPAARIKVAKRTDGYVVEAAIPLASLGLMPVEALQLRGDFGATLGNPGGTDTMLRAYWNNQKTGIVNDEVFELQMEPTGWGQLLFR